MTAGKEPRFNLLILRNFPPRSRQKVNPISSPGPPGKLLEWNPWSEEMAPSQGRKESRFKIEIRFEYVCGSPFCQKDSKSVQIAPIAKSYFIEKWGDDRVGNSLGISSKKALFKRLSLLYYSWSYWMDSSLYCFYSSWRVLSNQLLASLSPLLYH